MGMVGTPFSYALTASDGGSYPTQAYPAFFNPSGGLGLGFGILPSPLPAGLSIDPASGAITGTPTQAGTTSVLLVTTVGAQDTAVVPLTITIDAAEVSHGTTGTGSSSGTGSTTGSPVVSSGSDSGSSGHCGTGGGVALVLSMLLLCRTSRRPGSSRPA